MKALKIFLPIFLIILVFSFVAVFNFFILKDSGNDSQPPKSEAPVKEDRQNLPTVIIDAGHGGEDGGAIGLNGAYEKDINLIIAKKLKERLDARSIPCVLTRESDILLYDKNGDYEGKKKKLDLLARKELAEKYENAIFISIHQNSFSKSQYSGLQVYYSPNNAASYLLASRIQSTIKEELQPNNHRAIKKSSGIYLLEELFCPAVLIECGFLSNQAECERLCEESYQNAMCDILCEVIEKITVEIGRS